MEERKERRKCRRTDGRKEGRRDGHAGRKEKREGPSPYSLHQVTSPIVKSTAHYIPSISCSNHYYHLHRCLLSMRTSAKPPNHRPCCFLPQSCRYHQLYPHLNHHNSYHHHALSISTIQTPSPYEHNRSHHHHTAVPSVPVVLRAHFKYHRHY